MLDATMVFGWFMLLVGSVVAGVSALHARRSASVLFADETTGAPGDTVRIEGTVAADGDTVVAPFTGRDCVAVEFDEEERRLGTAYLPEWIRVDGGRRLTSFTLVTDAGDEVAVDGDAVVSLDASSSRRVGADETPPDPIADYRRGREGTAAAYRSDVPALARQFGLGDRRYLERRLDVGDEVTVVGRLTSDPGRIEPTVVSDASPLRTATRLGRQSVVGGAIGAFSVTLGLALLLL
ncbi:hypothetical protein [Halogeometricum rufum]|nr:hypothetical protein [Halogeometricum rufum]